MSSWFKRNEKKIEIKVLNSGITLFGLLLDLEMSEVIDI